MGGLCALIFSGQAWPVHGKPIFPARQVTKNEKKTSAWDYNLRPWHCTLRYIPLDHCLALPSRRAGTTWKPRDENFFRKLRDILGFHMTPTTEQPKGRCVWALELRSRALGTCFAEKSVRRFVRRLVGISSPIGGGGVEQGYEHANQFAGTVRGSIRLLWKTAEW